MESFDHKFSHVFWRYVPAHENKSSFFKYVETILTNSDTVPEFHDFYCIDSVTNIETGQVRVKNHSAPEYCVSKFVGWTLRLPTVEKLTKQEVFIVIHRSSFDHKKIEFDEFYEPINQRYTHEEWVNLLSSIEERFKKQKAWAIDGIKVPSIYQNGTPVFMNKTEFDAFSMGRRAYFLYHIVSQHRFIHLVRPLNVGYTHL